MKQFIKAILLGVLFIIFIGSMGAYDQNHISALQFLVQSGICVLGSWLTLKGWCKQ